MKIYIIPALFVYLASSAFAVDAERAANTIILHEHSVKNLRIETAEAEERTFENTFFSIGRIEARPHSRSVLSSRISGRITQLNAYVGDRVQKGQTLVQVESRQPGSPPPIISMQAPRSGLVLKSHVADGEPVEPDKELLDIVDLGKVWAVAKVPEAEAGQLKPGTKARVRIRAAGGKLMEGTLLRLGAEADRNSSTIDAIFVLENPDFVIRPGMRAEFSIITSSREDVLSIPRTAVQGDLTNRVVFVEDFDLKHAYIKSPVQLGAKNDLYIEVVKGLLPGDAVVTNGSYALSFAGGGGGPSLKEALDAAHGHEHNEDGSEITEDQKSATHSEGDGQSGENSGKGGINRLILIWAIITTVLLLIIFQRNILRKKTSSSPNA
ncbi:MAG: efflux RND transporter periplasmic adaptor subunit [Verrucomicrobiae bacterium]|nr:efflux RND transporter periplasmic adaptor subunit [Verrucomicrobiae bacterium]NNJ42669.1 efflux RND transporter periplasmic adaptor subunit [Akkermansiaceae bacterium]